MEVKRDFVTCDERDNDVSVRLFCKRSELTH